MTGQNNKKTKNKNIVMCLSPGRCGTNLLALLLDLADDTRAVHEPVPGFHSLIDSLHDNPEQALPFVQDIKIPAIQAQTAGNYVETSHLFGKGFFDAFITSGLEFQVIVLNRDPRDVARSLHRVKAIPTRSRKRAKYLLSPDYDGVMALPGWQGMSDYQLCFWYVLEMERRKELYIAKCAAEGIPMHEIAMTDLLDFDALRAFAARLRLDIPASAADAHAEISAVKINRKGRYLPKPVLLPRKRQEDAVWRAIGGKGRKLYAALCSRYGWEMQGYPGANDALDAQERVTNGRSQPA